MKETVVFLTAGFNQTFVITAKGQVYSWGSGGPWLGHRTHPPFSVSSIALITTSFAPPFSSYNLCSADVVTGHHVGQPRCISIPVNSFAFLYRVFKR